MRSNRKSHDRERRALGRLVPRVPRRASPKEAPKTKPQPPPVGTPRRAVLCCACIPRSLPRRSTAAAVHAPPRTHPFRRPKPKRTPTERRPASRGRARFRPQIAIGSRVLPSFGAARRGQRRVASPGPHPTSSVRSSRPPIPRRAGRPANRTTPSPIPFSLSDFNPAATANPSPAGWWCPGQTRPAPTDGRTDGPIQRRPVAHTAPPMHPLHVPRRVRHGPRAGGRASSSSLAALPLLLFPTPASPSSPRSPPHIYPSVRPPVSTRKRERGLGLRRRRREA